MPNIDDIYKSKYTGEEIDALLDKVQLQDFTYDSLKDKPIINQDLLIGGFTPQRNTYYRHTGRTASGFAKGIIYLYSGGKYTAIKGGSGGGGGGGGGYELPVATDTELGGVIVGNGLTITEDGILSLAEDIPTKVSQLQNDAGYTTNKGTVISILLNGTTYTADANGLVDLGTISGGTTYRSIYNSIY